MPPAEGSLEMGLKRRAFCGFKKRRPADGDLNALGKTRIGDERTVLPLKRRLRWSGRPRMTPASTHETRNP